MRCTFITQDTRSVLHDNRAAPCVVSSCAPGVCVGEGAGYLTLQAWDLNVLGDNVLGQCTPGLCSSIRNC